jgi:hypothetical protein
MKDGWVVSKLLFYQSLRISSGRDVPYNGQFETLAVKF